MLQKLIAGALSGFVATAPMTAVMESLFRRLPRVEQYPLPPSEITAVLTGKTGLEPPLESREHLALTLASHFGYGTAAGAGYGLLGSRLPLPATLRGVLYGLAMWASSYVGWLPLAGVLRPATEHPARRTALMLAAHVVWGLTLALVYELLRPARR
jgi:uncharacterized membrane protein YagU involved in acid resistance